MIDARVGDVVRVTLPWSEVCMHMRVADRVMDVRVLEHGAQLLNADGSNFSFPITHGEAGIRVTRPVVAKVELADLESALAASVERARAAREASA